MGLRRVCVKNIRDEAFVWVQVVVIAALWTAAIAVSTSKPAIGWELVKDLPHVVTAYAILAVVFTKWAWRWPIFRRWLVPFPDLQGTWEGEVIRVSKDPQAGSGSSIRCFLVVRQSFSAISCTLYTEESESHSTAATLSEAEEGGITRVSYLYLNRPRLSVRTGSEVHDGAAILSYAAAPVRTLSGEYFTSRLSRGEMHFTYRGQGLAEGFIPQNVVP